MVLHDGISSWILCCWKEWDFELCLKFLHRRVLLQEYVVVLVGHGKHRKQAIDDLKAFLGDQSEAFVTW